MAAKASSTGWLELVRSSGTHELHELRQRTTLGSSDEADIVLEGEAGIAAQHVLFVPQGSDGAWVGCAYGATAPVLLDGAATNDQVVPWGSELGVGPVRLRLHAQRPKVGAESARAGTSPSAFRTIALGGVAIVAVVCGLALARGGSPSQRFAGTTEPPALFDAPAVCPDNVEPSHRADSDLAKAAAKAERAPFSPEDGVEAVLLYKEAEACLQAAGRADALPWVARRREPLQRSIEERYSSYLVHLRLALDGEDVARALEMIDAIAPLIAHLPEGGFSERMRLVERRLQLRVGDPK